MEAQPKNIEQVINGWAEIFVDRLHEGLDRYEIGKLDGDLWRSIAYQLVLAGGDIEEVIFKFLAYGRFVDMGVGRGIPVGARGSTEFEKARKENGQLKRYGRKAKPWYSKTKTREVAILRTILIQDYGINTLSMLETTFNRVEIVNVN
jgi:hypothetical protein